MTREQFRTALDKCGCTLHYGNVYYEADDLIECLEDMKLFDSVELESCKDCISRQAVLKEFSCLSDDAFIISRKIQEIIKKLPSVEPERKPGVWIHMIGFGECEEQHYQCTNCSYYINFGKWGDVFIKQFKYCPNCGARMVEPQESKK